MTKYVKVRAISRTFYPPQVTPLRCTRAGEFVRRINWYFRISEADMRKVWIYAIWISNRVLATAWRYSVPRPHHAPHRFVLSVPTKEQARELYDTIQQILNRYGVPKVTRTEYLKDMWIMVLESTHEGMTELQLEREIKLPAHQLN